jgi:hypothetical protein
MWELGSSSERQPATGPQQPPGQFPGELTRATADLEHIGTRADPGTAPTGPADASSDRHGPGAILGSLFACRDQSSDVCPGQGSSSMTSPSQ